MKKIIPLFLIIIMITPIFAMPMEVKAQTLREAYAELAKLQTNATNTANKKKLTEAEMATTRNEISVIYVEIKNIQTETMNLEDEIIQLNKDIATKNKEIKELSKYIQVSSGESAYLEYAFGSETLTEFIYRMAVVEQLNDYNSNLIIGMKADIKANEQKTIELAAKQKELDSKEDQYVSKLALLGETKQQLEEAYSDISVDIAEAKALLSYYEQVGCKMDDDLNSCASKLPYNVNPKRPLIKGRITSDFGPRNLFGSSYHYGIDIGTATGTPLYPVANGIVTSISGANNKATCGGLNITIIYNIKGSYYTSVYMHLSSINGVRLGQVVSVDQVVAYSGNSGYCTTGPHLHFAMTHKARYVSGGLYGIPTSQVYSSYDAYKANAFNQRAMFGFGMVGTSFYTRNI